MSSMVIGYFYNFCIFLISLQCVVMVHDTAVTSSPLSTSDFDGNSLWVDFHGEEWKLENCFEKNPPKVIFLMENNHEQDGPDLLKEKKFLINVIKIIKINSSNLYLFT